MRHILIYTLLLGSLWAPATAHAAADCASGILGKTRGMFTFLREETALISAANSRANDLYRFLVATDPTGQNLRASLAIWSRINCSALEKGNSEAATLRKRWANTLGFWQVNGFTARAALSHYRKRLENSAPNTSVLSPAERTLIADSLSFLARQDRRFCSTAAELSKNINIPAKPPCGA